MPPTLRALVLLLSAAFVPPVAAAQVEPWPLPVESGSLPSLAPDRDALLLSWTEKLDDGHRLRYARHGADGFDAPHQIARGRDWFVNWADFPALLATRDGGLVAFVLQKSGPGAYAYDVRVLRSRDGERWSAPALVHDDGTRTEHGFVSLWPEGADGFGVAWLDGRETAGGGHHAGGHHGAGDAAMTLRAARFDARGKREEWPIDARTCDCCQTDAALADAGPILAYRDRGAGEIRDIFVTRLRDGAWSAPQAVHADGWVMPACPVNGPAIAAAGTQAWVAWYTAANDRPEVRLAHSSDDGARFAPPVTVASGRAVLGRVDLLQRRDAVYLSWLTEDAQGQHLWVARYGADLRAAPERAAVATLARGRATGFPRLGWQRGHLHVVYTDATAQGPVLRGARVRFDADAPSTP